MGPNSEPPTLFGRFLIWKFMKVGLVQLGLAFIFCLVGSLTVNGQPGRKPPPTRPSAGGSVVVKRPPKTPIAKTTETAILPLVVDPADASLFLSGQQVEGPTLRGIKPGSYILKASRAGYGEESRSITVVPGENAPITIRLEPLRGTLNVSPNISDCEITIRGPDNQAPKKFTNNVVNLSLPPGEYEITIARSGYREVKRQITIQPAVSIYLEPQLSADADSSSASPEAGPMTIHTLVAGDYLLVNLAGSSHTPAASGVLDVFIDPASKERTSVSGVLTGFPCQVELVPIDNVNEYSILERPEASNQFERLTLRIRPKFDTRPLHFAVRWTAVSNDTAGKSRPAAAPSSNLFEPATARKRVAPSYPPAARAAQTVGVVVVTVEINENGKVVSAKATTGPNALRQSAEHAAKQWEFNPARRNGVAVPSSQRLEFNFQL